MGKTEERTMRIGGKRGEGKEGFGGKMDSGI